MAFGILPALLSHARRTLTKVLRLDTDYTTARAVKLDTIDSTVSTNLDTTVSSRLADADAVARVQTGLNDNNYTAARGLKLDNLDNLDTTVSSRLSDSNAVARVQTGLDNNGYTSSRAANLDAPISSRAVHIGLAARESNTTVSALFQNLTETIGAGRLRGISVSTAPGAGCTVRVFIDGVLHGDIVFSGNISGHVEFNNGGSSTMFKAVETGFGTMIELDVFFKNAMQIQHKSNDGSSNTVIANFEEE